MPVVTPTRRRRGRPPLRALVTVLAVLATAVAGSSSARADQVYPATSDGILHLHGHGWGHGHGMSQYGALGAANAGLTWQSILSFYYQGTNRTSIGNPTLRVNVPKVSHNGVIQVKESSTLRLSWTGNAGTWSPIGSDTRAPADAWRIRASGTGSVIEFHRTGAASTTWTLWAVPPQGYAVFDDPGTGWVTAQSWSGTTVSQVVYRGQLRGIMSSSTLVPVVALPMEDYLKSVVPSESPSYWPLNALGAQAVAARSYAEYARRNPRSSLYDICDSTSCQVFSGTSVNGSTREYTSSNSAITATAGTVLTYGTGGSVIFAEFSSSNGGWSAYGGQPYLLARSDPYDGTPTNPNHSWNADIPVTVIQNRWPQIGTYRDLRVTQRDGNGDWGGRVVSAVIEGSAGSVTVSGVGIQAALGLKSEWFVPYNPPSAPSFPRDFTGDHRADVLAVDRSTGRLRIYPGNGTGGVQPPIVLSAGWGSPTKVFMAGSWDGDAISDVMALRSDGTLWLSPGNGAGGLATARQVASGWQGYDTVLAPGDFNGDGWSDLLARRTSDGALIMYPGNGQGGFLGSTVVGSGWGGFTALLSPGDFDGDGHPDVLGRTSDGLLWLYPANGSGAWRPKRLVGSGWGGFMSIVSPGDFDGDGHPDVLAVTWDGTMWLYPGNGTGGWKPRRLVSTGWAAMSSILR